MKNLYSLIICFVVCAVVLQHRMAHIGPRPGLPLKVTDWDNLGYYMYLPALFIYNDIEKLEWMPAIDARYHMVGGDFYQAEKLDNGNYVNKYLAGVAVMQAPFFFAAHIVAKNCHYPVDGFSEPYQYGVALAAIFYALLGVFLLRRFLLKYFDDTVVAISLFLLCLATNFLQYVAIDGGMSHAYIFLHYVLILYATKKWHDKPDKKWAAVIGYIIGFATFTRATEAVMLFIPLMWNTHTKEAAKAKWALVKINKPHIFIAVVSGFIAVLPQLVYWKYVSGSWLYDVGSAWDFLTPHFEALFGFRKGWFIYTSVTILFIIGMFFMKKQQWHKSVLWFCLLNMYIIISWREWWYAGSYSIRALMQSLPVFALPLASVVERVNQTKWRWAFYAAGIYLIAVNLFQHEQYYKTILHYDDMNCKYYGRIYLNANPTALDMSLLDNDEFLKSDKGFTKTNLLLARVEIPIRLKNDAQLSFFKSKLNITTHETWIKTDCNIKTNSGIFGAYLNTELKKGDSIKLNKTRLFSPISIEGISNRYIFYSSIPAYFNGGEMRVYISKNGELDAVLQRIDISILEK